MEQQLAQLAAPPLLEAEVDEFPVGDAGPESQSEPHPIISLNQLLDQVVANGLPPVHVDVVRELLETFPDVWLEAAVLDPPIQCGASQCHVESRRCQPEVLRGNMRLCKLHLSASM